MKQIFIQRQVDKIYRVGIPVEILNQLDTRNIDWRLDKTTHELVMLFDKTSKRSIDKNNRAVIPSVFAKFLGLKEGDLMNMDFYDDRVIMWRAEA